MYMATKRYKSKRNTRKRSTKKRTKRRGGATTFSTGNYKPSHWDYIQEYDEKKAPEIFRIMMDDLQRKTDPDPKIDIKKMRLQFMREIYGNQDDYLTTHCKALISYALLDRGEEYKVKFEKFEEYDDETHGKIFGIMMENLQRDTDPNPRKSIPNIRLRLMNHIYNKKYLYISEEVRRPLMDIVTPPASRAQQRQSQFAHIRGQIY